MSSEKVDLTIQYTKQEEEIINSVFVEKRNVFLSGPGGTGKSYLVSNYIKNIALEKELKIALTSTTGISALSLGGTTIHRWSGIKLGKESVYTITSRIRNRKECLSRIINTNILVIDEISMFGLNTFNLLDNVLKEIRENDKPFGGIRMILIGDFLQLPPVNDEFVFKSEVWDLLNLKYFKFETPKRYNDVTHFEMLLRVRCGTLTKEDKSKINSRVKSYMEYIGNGMEKKDEIKPTRIFALKKDVELYNNTELNKLTTPLFEYKSVDKFYSKIKSKDGTRKILKDVPSSKIKDCTEYLNTIIPVSVSLKVESQVMLTYNLSVENGLVNGSRGVVKSLEEDGVVVLFKNDLTTKISYKSNDFEDMDIIFERSHIPLILAWGISIHKTQGSTLDCAIMDIGPSIFSPGMAYVALSRIKTLDGVYISNFLPNKIWANTEALEFEEMIDTLISTQEIEPSTKELENKDEEEELVFIE